MIKRMKKKLSSRRGETVAEVLIAVLVVCLGVGLMAGAATTASKLNATAQERDKSFYEELATAEGRTGGAKRAVLTVTIGSTDHPIDVDVYGGEGKLHAYEEAEK